MVKTFQGGPNFESDFFQMPDVRVMVEFRSRSSEDLCSQDPRLGARSLPWILVSFGVLYKTMWMLGCKLRSEDLGWKRGLRAEIGR